MRALTMDEVGFVSGGEDDPPVIVTGKRNPVTPGWGVWYPEDLVFAGLTIMDLVNTGEFVLTGGGTDAQKARLAAFLANTTRTVNANGTVTVTFKVSLTITGNVPIYGTYQFSAQRGDSITGSDRSGGARGAPSGIPDLLDTLLNGSAIIKWG